ncbi:hypothetical protein [Vogesella oryzae]|uniref:hypothetical protein n=1 Tax=Vogesella oryzae TaxID=1735285 RepID=UPI0015818549|nr:hypothetical protein [Vogesella oryzae]
MDNIDRTQPNKDIKMHSNKLKKHFTIVLILTTQTPHVLAAKKPCEDYQRPLPPLTGVIKEKFYPGPPNFNSIADGDARLSAWLFYPDKKSCVLDYHGIEASDVDPIKSAQLIVPEKLEKLVGRMTGKRVMIIGQFEPANNGNFIAPVGLVIERIRLQP